MGENSAAMDEAVRADAIATTLSAAAQYCLDLAQPSAKAGKDKTPTAHGAALRVAG
jgi:hypothetical protein